MDKTSLFDKLAAVEASVVRGERYIARQWEIIAELRRQKLPTAKALDQVDAAEATYNKRVAERNQLLAELKRLEGSPAR